MYEEDNPPDIAFPDVCAIIQKHLPDVKEDEIKFLYHGTHNVYDVQNRYIFRFPSTILSSEERRSLVERESHLLKTIQPHISLQIPDPEFVNIDHEHPHVGYHKLPGASIYRFYDDAPLEKKRRIGETLGRFLGELHSINLDELWQDIPEQVFDQQADRADQHQFFERIQREVYPNLSDSQIEWTDNLFHDFLDNDENFEYTPALAHCDFDTTNILADPETLEVSGIIDFEETRMFDPAVDFLFQEEGVECMKAMLKVYPREIDSQFSTRVAYRLGRQPFIYIISGLDFGLERMKLYGYRGLDETINTWDRYSSVTRDSFAALRS